MFEELATTMEEDQESVGGSSRKETANGSSKKRKVDRLADAISGVAESFRAYLQSKTAENSKANVEEVREVVKKVEGIRRDQVLRASQRFINGKFEEFQMLKTLPDDEKLDWVILSWRPVPHP